MQSLNRPPLKLLFGTPEFLPAGVVQSTVRVGQKWRDDLAGKVAPRISCVDLDGTVLGTATVVGTLYGSFKDFAYIGSNVNHQENCRDVEGLIDVLSECYPDFNPETNVVTVIFFKYAPVAVEADDESAEEAEEEVTTEDDDKSDDKSDSTAKVEESKDDTSGETSAEDKDKAEADIAVTALATESDTDSEAVASDEKAAVAESGGESV